MYISVPFVGNANVTVYSDREGSGGVSRSTTKGQKAARRRPQLDVADEEPYQPSKQDVGKCMSLLPGSYLLGNSELHFRLCLPHCVIISLLVIV